MKIIHVISHFSMGDGISNVIRDLSEELKDKFDIEIWYSYSLRGIPKTSAKIKKMSPKKMLKKLLKINKTTVVHSHFGKTFLFASIARRFNKNLIHFHTDYVNPPYKITGEPWWSYYRVKLSDFLAYSFGWGIDLSSGISEYACREIKKNLISNKKIIKVELGTNIPKIKENKKNGDLTFGCLARFSKSKNIKFLADNFEKFPKGSNLILAGAIDLLNKDYFLECKIVSEKKGIKIQSNLSNKEFEEFFESIDVFLFPSNWEGFGLPIIEAMARGKPVMCFNKFAMPELISSGKDGFVAKNEKDFIEKLKLFANPNLLNKLKKGALIKSKKYRKDIMGRKYLKIINKLIREHENKK